MPNSPKASLVPPLAAPRPLGVVLLAVLDPAGHQHGAQALRSGCRGGAAAAGGGLGRGGASARRRPRAVRARRTVAAASHGVGRSPPRARTAAAAGAPARAAAWRLALGAGAGDLALVDPDLHADAAEGRPGLVEAVVDVGAQRVQGHAALAVELRARHLGAAEAAGALDPDALGTGAHRGLHRLAHRATERHAAGRAARPRPGRPAERRSRGS